MPKHVALFVLMTPQRARQGSRRSIGRTVRLAGYRDEGRRRPLFTKEFDMRKIITTTFVTMDGVMQAPGGPEEDTSGRFKYGGWQAQVMDGSLGEAINEFLKPPFAMLLGHTTYNIFAGYW